MLLVLQTSLLAKNQLARLIHLPLFLDNSWVFRYYPFPEPVFSPQDFTSSTGKGITQNTKTQMVMIIQPAKHNITNSMQKSEWTEGFTAPVMLCPVDPSISNRNFALSSYLAKVTHWPPQSYNKELNHNHCQYREASPKFLVLTEISA